MYSRLSISGLGSDCSIKYFVYSHFIRVFELVYKCMGFNYQLSEHIANIMDKQSG